LDILIFENIPNKFDKNGKAANNQVGENSYNARAPPKTMQ